MVGTGVESVYSRADCAKAAVHLQFCVSTHLLGPTPFQLPETHCACFRNLGGSKFKHVPSPGQLLIYIVRSKPGFQLPPYNVLGSGRITGQEFVRMYLEPDVVGL